MRIITLTAIALVALIGGQQALAHEDRSRTKTWSLKDRHYDHHRDRTGHHDRDRPYRPSFGFNDSDFGLFLRFYDRDDSRYRHHRGPTYLYHPDRDRGHRGKHPHRNGRWYPEQHDHFRADRHGHKR